MKTVKIGVAVFLIFIYYSCTKNYDYTTTINNPSPITSSLLINGTVFKGSFLRGSQLSFFELDSAISQTGRSFSTIIQDDYGNFSLKALNLKGKLIRVVGDGFYWNEVLNENSATRITLTSIAKVDSNEAINVNVLTHLERPRVEYLYSVKQYSFDSAKAQAVSEVLKMFGYLNTGIKRAEKVTVAGTGKDSKILLAISTIVQGFRQESEVTQILNDIAEDLKTDGVLSDNSIGNELKNHLYYIDTANVISNIKNKLGKLYNKDTVNTLNLSYLSIFQDSTKYVRDRNLIEFPSYERNGRYKNILFDTTTTFSNGNFGISANVTRKGLGIKVEIVNEDGTTVNPFDFSFAIGLEMGWQIAKPNFFMPTYTSSGTGLQDFYTLYNATRKYRVNIYEKGGNTPTRIKYINLIK